MPGRPRLTGGRLKGRGLVREVPGAARPTSSRVREALFSMVGQDLDGQRVLDAFGGSGLLALEACSRGAEVVVVEQNRAAARIIRANLAAFDVPIAVRIGDVTRLISELGVFDGVLADPPYAMDPEPFLHQAASSVTDWLVLEADATRQVPESAASLRLDRSRRYGGTALHLYRSNP